MYSLPNFQRTLISSFKLFVMTNSKKKMKVSLPCGVIFSCFMYAEQVFAGTLSEAVCIHFLR